jgi:hypothetical protein
MSEETKRTDGPWAPEWWERSNGTAIDDKEAKERAPSSSFGFLDTSCPKVGATTTIPTARELGGCGTFGIIWPPVECGVVRQQQRRSFHDQTTTRRR